MKKLHKLLPCLFLFAATTAFAQPQITLQPLASGFTSPLNLTHANDSRFFVVQQQGLIKIMDLDGNITSRPFLDLSNKVSQSGGERGLLGLAFHPQYHSNGHFYVNYTRITDGATVVSRFSVSKSDPDVADSLSEEILFTQSQPYANHNGGDLRFGPDGYLYIALGDGGSGGDPQNNALNRKTMLGKILRIDVDNGSPYGIPPNNPFVGDTSALDEIWALGLRNPWRNSFDRLTGDYWIADVGQNAWEEVNFQSATSTGGENYGWRCYEGNATYNTGGCGSASQYVFPVLVYAQQGSNCGGSVTGGYVYRGALYNGLYGKYLATDFCKGDFYWVQQNDTGFVSGKIGTFSPFQYSSFGEDVYGELYVTSLGSGNVHKITDTSDCRPVAMITGAATVEIDMGDTATLTALHHPSLQYKWSRNGNEIPGADQYTYYATQAGNYTVEVTNPANTCNNVSEAVEVIVKPLSVTEKAVSNISIYPNPAKDEITVEGLPVSEAVKIQLAGITGQTFKSFTVPYREKFTIRTEELSPGIYFLKINSGAHQTVKKLVISR